MNLIFLKHQIAFTLCVSFFYSQSILLFGEDSSEQINESKEWENPFKPDEVDQAIDSGIEFLLSKQKEKFPLIAFELH